MDHFSIKEMRELCDDRDGPCVSIYTQTHRGGSGAEAGHWKHQLETAEAALVERGLKSQQATELCEDARALLKNHDFWKHSSDGLAIFIAKGFLRTYRLPIKVPDRVIAGSQFYIKPLLPWVSGDGRYYILAFSQSAIRLLEASAHSVHQIAPNGLGERLKSMKRVESESEKKEIHAIFHGHATEIDDHKDNLLHYFQKLDRTICHLIGDTTVPLVLASVDYLLPIYRQASKYHNIVDATLVGNSDRLTDQELQQKSWPLVEHLFAKKSQSQLEKFHQWSGTGRTTQDLDALVAAAQKGELESLFIATDRDIWGTKDATAEKLAIREVPQKGDDELTNLSAVYMHRHNRAVNVVKPEGAFEKAPVAGVYYLSAVNQGR